jgi:glycosyltransferase involved in cell wall biosynthesis
MEMRRRGRIGSNLASRGLSLDVLQAIAGGLRVIASENTFGRDVWAEGAGGYAEPIGTLSISEYLKHLTASPAIRIEMGNAAAIGAREISWERTAALFGWAIDARGKPTTL